jgi:hypothetical protein
MDQEARIRRREAARKRTRRRRLLAIAVPLACVAVVLGLASLINGDSDRSQAESEPPPELPRGGRSILPEWRVVAFYGAPQDPQLGVLGMGEPEKAGRRLERQARGYRRRGRPVLPAFELITTIAANAPGDGGEWATRQPPKVIDRYLAVARRHRALLLLDIQPGRADFMGEVRALSRWLEQPDVGLALDPEWRVGPGEVPGQVLGSTDAATINEVSAYLSRIIREGRLPEKLLVVHRFTHDMIREEEAIRQRPGVALTINVDGFGDQPIKIAKYQEFTRPRRREPNGFKLFYEEDTNLMSPRQVLRLRPPPDLVVYE